ncbi:unnamed protein product [Notodromas monacha]|uniref:Prominin-like protein n=1 Tax=Notodromas monacha TaxID=399045 RepID=A0A7R9G985_9CRUS|nr:unnamed protein product [Notodromas monacha]CAG0912935.1 unnamed protein product [Notodromas monacha]
MRFSATRFTAGRFIATLWIVVVVGGGSSLGVGSAEAKGEKVSVDWLEALDELNIKETYPELLRFYWAPLICLGVGLALVILLPFSCLVFFLCRACGKCGKRAYDIEEFEEKGDACKRGFLNLLLLVVIVFLAFGAVVVLVNAQFVKEGCDELPPKMRDFVDGINTYMNRSAREARVLMIDNYKDVQDRLFSDLDRTGLIVRDYIVNVSGAYAVDELAEIADVIPKIGTELENLQRMQRDAQTKLRVLSTGLKELQRTMEDLRRCPEKICDSLLAQYPLEDLLVTDDLLDLPDLTGIIGSVEELVDEGIVRHASVGRALLNSVNKTVQDRVESVIPSIKEKLKEIGDSIDRWYAHLRSSLVDVDFSSTADRIIEQTEYVVDKVLPLGVYVTIGMAGVVMLITCILLMGLIFGLFGTPVHHYYGEAHCSRRTGAHCYIFAVYAMMLVPMVVMLVATIFFAFGAVSSRMVCTTLTEFPDNSITEALNQITIAKTVGSRTVEVHLVDLMKHCHRNQSMNDVFNWGGLWNMDNLTSLPVKNQVDKNILDFISKIELPRQPLRLINETAKSQLARFTEVQIFALNIELYRSLPSRNLVEGDLKRIETAVNDTAESLGKSGHHEWEGKMYNLAFRLEAQERLLSETQRLLSLMATIGDQLITYLEYKNTPLQLAVETRVELVAQSQDRLNARKPEITNMVRQRFSEDLKQVLNETISEMVRALKSDFGRCGPVSKAYNTTVDTFCDNVMLPFSGVWAGLGWSVLLFIPAIIFAILLSALYARIKQDPRMGYTESEYFYDAYSDRDNLPLAHVDKKDSRAAAAASYAQRLNASSSNQHQASTSNGPGYSAVAGSRLSSAPPATNDEWLDFPNGGPPQYSSNDPRLGPEYDRPPPYYYPGPKFDIYRKVPKDLTQPTLTGAVISICCCLFMAVLFISEFMSFISPEIVSELFVDNPGSAEDRIPVRINISLPRLPCQYVGLDIQDEMGRHEVGFVENTAKVPIENNAGCLFSSTFHINKVPGNFHVSTHSANVQPDDIDFAHTIHEVRFGESLDKTRGVLGAFNPMSNLAKLDANALESHNYVLKVVPTVFETSRGESSLSYQYSYAYRSFVNFGHGGRVIPALWFRYDLNPITVKYHEKRPPFYSFLTTVCAIVGGTFTVAGIIDSCIFTASEVLKKFEIGKLS